MWPFTKAAAPIERKFASVMLPMGRASWSGHNFRQLATEGFEYNPIVAACVTKIARAAAGIDLHLYDYTRQGDLRKVDKHPILDLINAPNAAWSGRQFVEKILTHHQIGGNAYVLADNGEAHAPNQIWVLPPEKMTIVNPRGDFLPDAYRYQPGTAAERTYPVNKVTGQCAILHLKTVNPLDEWTGLAPMAPASYAIDVFNAGQEWNKSILQNEGRPSGVLQMREGKDGSPAFLSDEQFDRLKADVNASYTGSGNAGKPLILEGGLEWKQIGLSARDMDHRETMLTNARFIASVYGVPEQLLNIPGSSTFANYEQAMMSFYADTVLPLLGLILEDINRWLPRLFGAEKMFLWYDEEQIPALEPRRKEKFSRINGSLFMTYDEKREATGMEAYVQPAQPGADSLFVPANQIPIELAGTVDPKHPPGTGRGWGDDARSGETESTEQGSMMILFTNDDLHLMRMPDGTYRLICLRELKLDIDQGDDIQTRINARPLESVE